jgi:hypothetical protein
MRCLIIKILSLLKYAIILNVVLITSFSHATELKPHTCKITPNSIAKIKLGTCLNQIKLIYPNSILTRSTDGDGMALVSLKVGKQDLGVIYAGEEDPNSKVNLSKKIEYIETLNPRCQSTLGIHSGMLVENAAKLLGGIDEITLSEIESRQYVSFKKQPKQFIHRIDYCGEFKNDERITKKYQLGCKIFSIAISDSK